MNNQNLEEDKPQNYLVEVACELQFIPLLSIREKITEFQGKIRIEFPDIELGYPIQYGSSLPPHLDMTEWKFISTDKKKQIRIGVNRIAMMIKSYSRFTTFFEEMLRHFQTFWDTTTIAEFNRIGLRYINSIPLTNEEISPQNFLGLFNPLIDKELINSKNPNFFNTECRWSNGEYKLTCRSALGVLRTGNYFYSIDIDSYLEKGIKKEEVGEQIKLLKSKAFDEFKRNCTQKFLDRLGIK